jgi:hypothetical protein
MIDIDLQAYLATLTSLPVQQDVISEDKGQPRIWFQRRNGNDDLFLSGAVALTETTFDVEVSGLDIDQVQATASEIKTGLNGFLGPMNGENVLGCFVNDQADDYISKSLNADDGYHVAAFSVQIIQ